MNPLTPPEKDPLEDQLKAGMKPIPDNGFSLRVLSALPAPEATRSHPSLRRGVLSAIGAVLGLAIPILRHGLPKAESFHADSTRLAENWSLLSPASMDNGLLWTAGAIVAVSFFVAFQREILGSLRKI